MGIQIVNVRNFPAPIQNSGKRRLRAISEGMRVMYELLDEMGGESSPCGSVVFGNRNEC